MKSLGAQRVWDRFYVALVHRGYETHVGPSKVWKGPKQDGQKIPPSLIGECEDTNIPLSPNFKKPWGPSRVWKGPKQDGQKSCPSLINECEDTNIPLSPNFKTAFWACGGFVAFIKKMGTESASNHVVYIPFGQGGTKFEKTWTYGK